MRPLEKLAVWIPVTEEMLVDLGYEPSLGYWLRQEAKAIDRRRIRTRLRVLRYRIRWAIASIPRRLAHAGNALLDHDCSRHRGFW